MNQNNFYKAFANEHRLRLLQCLSKPQNVSMLLEHCSFTQSALSQHLKILRDVKMVKTEKRGKEIVYSVSNKQILQITKLLLNYK